MPMISKKDDLRPVPFGLVFPNTIVTAEGLDVFLSRYDYVQVLSSKDHDPTTEQLVDCEPYYEKPFVYTVRVEPRTEPIVPDVVTMRQARLALLGAGLLPMVETALNSLEEPQRSAALIEWEYAQEVKRDYPWVTQMVAVMGLTDEQVDNLFRAAAVL